MASRIVVTDHAFPDLELEERVAREHGASFASFSCRSEDEVAKAVSGAKVALVNFAPVTRLALTQMERGATVIRYGIGVDNVDLRAAHDLGIAVANVPDYGVATVADHAAASLLALARRLLVYDRRVRSEGWLLPGDIGPVPGLRSLVVGLVGFGRIAREVHTRLRAFGFTFVAHDPFVPSDVFDRAGVEAVPLHQLAERADAISLHVPSTPETYHLVDAAFLRRVRTGAVLVNTARGPLIDADALADALRDRHLAGVALDVTEPEPLPPNSPLRDLPEVLLTPHAAFYDDDSVRNLQRLASEEAARALRSERLRSPVTIAMPAATEEGTP